MATHLRRVEPDVCLVLMPYGPIETPSIAIGLLKSVLAAAKLRVAVHHGNLPFAERIGPSLYGALSHSPPEHQLAEWTFARAAFDDLPPGDETYLNRIGASAFGRSFAESFKHLGDISEILASLRRQAESWIDEIASSVLDLDPRIVGCSSMFQQTCASLALLRRIRERDPEITTLLGGANCESPMGEAILDVAPWVDVAVSGEADGLIADLCRALIERGRELGPADLKPGILVRRAGNGEDETPARAIQLDLDGLPTPDYGEYFEFLRDSTISSAISPGIPIESSRGCWWGEKHHCTFCGLNGRGMGYRSKSAQRVVTEFRELRAKHSLDRFHVVDNILEMSHIDSVLPRLAEQEVPLTIFYETKANLRKDQIEKLAKAGVTWIQPGLEALDDRLLPLLNKGNTAQINLRLLKWARESGVAVMWNLLCNAPGDSDSWYGEVAEWIPLIEHLQPPNGLFSIRFDRFSPYHQRPDDFDLSLRPHWGYRQVFPATADLDNLAYYFEDESEWVLTRGMQGPGIKRLEKAVGRWKARWSEGGFSTTPALAMEKREDGSSLIADRRSCSREESSILDATEASILALCDAGIPRKALAGAFARRLQLDIPESVLGPAVGRLGELGLLLALGDRLLSLVLNAESSPLPGQETYPAGSVHAESPVPRKDRQSTPERSISAG